MPPRSFNGWRDWAMANLGYTLGEAEEYARMRLTTADINKRVEDWQQSLLEDSEQRGAPIPPQDEVGSSPQRQPRPAAPGKDSGREAGGDRSEGAVAPRRPSSRPEYDPRTSDWPGDY